MAQTTSTTKACERRDDAGHLAKRNGGIGGDRATLNVVRRRQAKIMSRLPRMEGQVRGVQRMAEEDQYCVDVLTQLSAIIAAARKTGLLVLEDHIRGCVLGTCCHGHADQEEMLAELSEAIERFTRSAS